jgi:hypothetical protein
MRALRRAWPDLSGLTQGWLAQDRRDRAGRQRCGVASPRRWAQPNASTRGAARRLLARPDAGMGGSPRPRPARPVSGMVGFGTSLAAAAAHSEGPELGNLNRRLTFRRHLFFRVVHATVGLRPARFRGCRRTPRIGWTRAGTGWRSMVSEGLIGPPRVASGRCRPEGVPSQWKGGAGGPPEIASAPYRPGSVPSLAVRRS